MLGTTTLAVLLAVAYRAQRLPLPPTVRATALALGAMGCLQVPGTQALMDHHLSLPDRHLSLLGHHLSLLADHLLICTFAYLVNLLIIHHLAHCHLPIT